MKEYYLLVAQPVALEKAKSEETTGRQTSAPLVVPVEIQVAVHWWIEKLDKLGLTEEQVAMFKDHLIKVLLKKFAGHWYPQNPSLGNAFRSLLCDSRSVDKTLVEAARKSYIGNIQKRLGEECLIMWVDPGQVEVKYFSANTREVPIILYSTSLSINSSPNTSPQRGMESTHKSTFSQIVGSPKGVSVQQTPLVQYAKDPAVSIDCKGFVNNLQKENFDASWQSQVGLWLK